MEAPDIEADLKIRMRETFNYCWEEATERDYLRMND